MRIAVVCPYALDRPGGGQTHTVDLVARLRSCGEDAYLVAPGRAPGLPGVDVGRAVTVRANRSTVPVSVDPRAWWRARRALVDADLVHVHEPLMPLVGPASLRSGAPTVATFHAAPPRWVRAAYRLLARPGRWLLEGSALTAVSPVAAAAIPPGWGRPDLIPIAVDVSGYRVDVARDPNRVVFVGRDDPRKGLGTLLEAWPEIRRSHPEAELVVVGADRVEGPVGARFVGRVDEGEKRRWLASSEVFVAPNSGAESFGTTLIEAMAAGCAVVASSLPAFRWVLDGGGRVVPPDDPGRLAAAVSGLLADPAERDALRAAAALAVARFDWPVVLDRYREVYARTARMR